VHFCSECTGMYMNEKCADNEAVRRYEHCPGFGFLLPNPGLNYTDNEARARQLFDNRQFAQHLLNSQKPVSRGRITINGVPYQIV